MHGSHVICSKISCAFHHPCLPPKMDCPVCFVNLGHLEFDVRLRHVNHCLDTPSSSNSNLTERNQQSSSSRFTGLKSSKIECPVCMKSGTTAAHIKKCGKSNGILPKRLVSLVGKNVCSPALRRDNGKSGKGVKKHQALLLKDSQNGNITKEVEEKMVKIDQNFINGLKYSIVDNKSECGFNDEVNSSAWKLCSLSTSDALTVPGFKKYCISLNIKSNLTGFPSSVETAVKPDTVDKVVIDHTKLLLENLKLLMNNPVGSDLIVKAAGNKVLYCHVFIWRMHRLKESLIVMNEPEQPYVDCMEFQEVVILKFLNYCYTGTLCFENDEENLWKVSLKLHCAALLQHFSSKGFPPNPSSAEKSLLSEDMEITCS